MKLLIVAVKDLALNILQPPFAVRGQGEAIRAFQDAVNADNQTQLVNHPEDYELWAIAEFDDDTGKLIAPDQPYTLVRAKDLVLEKKKNNVDTQTILDLVNARMNNIGITLQQLGAEIQQLKPRGFFKR